MEALLKPRPDSHILDAKLPEWAILESILAELPKQARIIELGHTQNSEHSLPLTAIEFGSQAPEAPTLLLVGGVHGLERIGSQVVLSQLQSFVEICAWDEMVNFALQKVRVAFLPMLNPLGIMMKTRSNPNGVDLMRNSPVESDGEDENLLLGGHRFGDWLPWFRGYGFLEAEAQALYDYVKKITFQSSRVITMDVHSGFGRDDRLWFPFAHSRKPFTDVALAYAFKQHFDKTHPHHFYIIEPQSRQYTMSGDLWDYFYLEYKKEGPLNGKFLALTLEMGSWLWVRKNPWQLFSLLGPFNPVLPHRLKRILRRHNTLFEFLLRSTVSEHSWADMNDEQRAKYEARALELWY